MNRIAPAITLGILIESNRPVSRIRWMKLLFLLRHEADLARAGAFYEFLPYKFGPYSFFADRDLQGLTSAGLVIAPAGTRGDQLTIPQSQLEEARKAYFALTASVRAEVAATVNRYRSWSNGKLIESVYERFSDYTVLSKLTPTPRTFAAPAVYTMGYEGHTVDAFLNAIIRQRMARLLDVRNNPLSRRYGFSKKTLSALCEKIGVEYVHVPELGIPSSHRQSLSDFDSYQRLFDEYEADMLPGQPAALTRAAALMQEKASVLVCFEADVRCCHRGRLSKWIASQTGLSVQHLTLPDA